MDPSRWKRKKAEQSIDVELGSTREGAPGGMGRSEAGRSVEREAESHRASAPEREGDRGAVPRREE